MATQHIARNCSDAGAAEEAFSLTFVAERVSPLSTEEVNLSSVSIPSEVLPLILSKTTPRDVGKLATVSREFAKAAKSDLVWRKMLPPDYEWIASNVREGPVRFESLKDLYLGLTNHLLLGEGLEGYGIDSEDGGIYRSYSAKTLQIPKGSQMNFWNWVKEKKGSRFKEVAYLRDVCWLELRGEVKTKLPPGTYTLSWVLRFKKNLGKWKNAPVTFTFINGSDIQISKLEMPPSPGHERVKRKSNNWFEYCAGDFTVEEPDVPGGDMREVDLKYEMKEVVKLVFKKGLYVDGVVIRQENVHALH